MKAKQLTPLQQRVLKLSNAGWEDIDIAEELQLDEDAVGDIVDWLDSQGLLE